MFRTHEQKNTPLTRAMAKALRDQRTNRQLNDDGETVNMNSFLDRRVERPQPRVKRWTCILTPIQWMIVIINVLGAIFSISLALHTIMTRKAICKEAIAVALKEAGIFNQNAPQDVKTVTTVQDKKNGIPVSSRSDSETTIDFLYAAIKKHQQKN